MQEQLCLTEYVLPANVLCTAYEFNRRFTVPEMTTIFWLGGPRMWIGIMNYKPWPTKIPGPIAIEHPHCPFSRDPLIRRFFPLSFSVPKEKLEC
jgi:hypothetical protein